MIQFRKGEPFHSPGKGGLSREGVFPDRKKATWLPGKAGFLSKEIPFEEVFSLGGTPFRKKEKHRL